MNTKDLIYDKKVKVFFGKRGDLRTPMLTKIVKLADADELSSKGMVRMILSSFLDIQGEPTAAWTRIYVVSDFSQVIPVLV